MVREAKCILLARLYWRNSFRFENPDYYEGDLPSLLLLSPIKPSREFRPLKRILFWVG